MFTNINKYQVTSPGPQREDIETHIWTVSGLKEQADTGAAHAAQTWGFPPNASEFLRVIRQGKRKTGNNMYSSPVSVWVQSGERNHRVI